MESISDMARAKLTPLENVALDGFFLAKWLEAAANERLAVLVQMADDGFAVNTADPDGMHAHCVDVSDLCLALRAKARHGRIHGANGRCERGPCTGNLGFV